VLALLVGVTPTRAGVTNPNISILGQPFSRWTNDENDPDVRRATLDVGETEVIYDDYLNPYAKGFFTISFGADDVEVEEGYFTLLRGLPAGLTLKGGKYRVGFGKLNPLHPHAVPFADRPRVLAAYMPGDESFNETGVQLSGRLPSPGDVSINASADWLKGDSFLISRSPSGDPGDPLLSGGDDRAQESRPAGIGRLSAFIPIHDRSGLEIGFSGTQGTNNVAAGTRTTVLGGDVKLKLWTSASAYLLLQGEVMSLDRENAAWDSTTQSYGSTSVKPFGGYVFADYNFGTRYNAGVSYEHFEEPTATQAADQAFGAFAGLSLLEESTVFRLDWNHFMPGNGSATPDNIDTVTLRVIFSMGPHKAHQF